ncbi:phage tail protein [Lelliottia amnigena]|uniref:phage tail-collar fiber domain-containing protein n=1 Tax=Lelliottia amnigena TaxID=61646 RepID=UPI00192A6DA1|nr:phage tail protein [Lelliottia amnigena]MBL5920590.1 phage tail protein [Lelliottia amnigena]
MSAGLVLTNSGSAEIEAAYQAGETVKITLCSFGDGGGEPVTADPSATALRGRFGEVPLSAGDAFDGMIGGMAIIPCADYPGKIVREFGLESESGTLIAYGAYPETYLPAQGDSVIKELIVKFVMPLVHAENVTLIVDPNIAIITQEEGDKRYYRRALRLQEVQDEGAAAQQELRENIGCGTSATKDIVTSTSDTTAGRVLTTGWEGLGLSAEFKMGVVSQFLAYSGASPEVPLNGAGWQAAYAPLRRAQAFIGGDTKFYSRFSASADALDSATPWATHYTTLNKPAATDVDAVSASQGGTFQKSVTFNQGLTSKGQVAWGDYAHNVGDVSYNAMVNIYDAGGKMRWAFGPYKGGWSVYCYDPTGAYVANLLNIDYTSKNATFAGEVIPGSYANFDARYMGKSNAYTKTESDARYAMSPNLAGFGGVGTYAFLSCNSAVSNGANVAGASLFSSGIAAQKSSVGYGDKSMVIQGSAMAGTWKCLGNQPAPSGNDVGATLYYRIA